MGRVPTPSSAAPQHRDFEQGLEVGADWLAGGARGSRLDDVIPALIARGLQDDSPSDSLPRLLSGFAHGLRLAELAERKPQFLARLVGLVLQEANEQGLSTSQLQGSLHAIALAISKETPKLNMRVDYVARTVLAWRTYEPVGWSKSDPALAATLCDGPIARAGGGTLPSALQQALGSNRALAVAWFNGQQGRYLEPLWTIDQPPGPAASEPQATSEFEVDEGSVDFSQPHTATDEDDETASSPPSPQAVHLGAPGSPLPEDPSVLLPDEQALSASAAGAPDYAALISGSPLVWEPAPVELEDAEDLGDPPSGTAWEEALYRLKKLAALQPSQLQDALQGLRDNRPATVMEASADPIEETNLGTLFAQAPAAAPESSTITEARLAQLHKLLVEWRATIQSLQEIPLDASVSSAQPKAPAGGWAQQLREQQQRLESLAVRYRDLCVGLGDAPLNDHLPLWIDQVVEAMADEARAIALQTALAKRGLRAPERRSDESPAKAMEQALRASLPDAPKDPSAQLDVLLHLQRQEVLRNDLFEGDFEARRVKGTWGSPQLSKGASAEGRIEFLQAYLKRESLDRWRVE